MKKLFLMILFFAVLPITMLAQTPDMMAMARAELQKRGLNETEVRARLYDEGIDVEDQYDDVENVIIGYKIKEKRIDLNLSQEELAKKIGIDQSDLSKIEKGNANPSIKTIHKIITGLNSRISIKID